MLPVLNTIWVCLQLALFVAGLCDKDSHKTVIDFVTEGLMSVVDWLTRISELRPIEYENNIHYVMNNRVPPQVYDYIPQLF